jgi:hypothetical protein
LAASDSLAFVPRPGSTAFHRRTERSPWREGSHRDRQRRRLSLQSRDRCSRTRTCGPPGRFCSAAGIARHTEHRHRSMPWPAAALSTLRTQKAVICLAIPVSACLSPACRLASSQDAAYPSAHRARGRHSDAVKAHNPRLNTHLFGNHRVLWPSAASKTIRARFRSHCTVRARRSATSLQLLAIAPPKSHFSCFGNHPDLESRLTLHEKRVLDCEQC